MTPLIDVIFLLLLFFMLSSTFSKFSEIELSSGSRGGTGTDRPPYFMQLGPERILLNGVPVQMAALGQSDLAQVGAGSSLIVSLKSGVSAQRLTDLLVILRTLPGLNVTVLGT